ncbi:hypothetical protein C8F04DRAFT_1237995 [Mycena alexandri]|uniref:Cytochrome b5 heme-binding domain-containing protein n=1 Tax=Mycena alexandri TaxID=1745969 RepID=A0AAD6SLE8_9AGAR|nr:hypothetical protein C8F04DRAFT_1237995 [Mycena alexandri]
MSTVDKDFSLILPPPIRGINDESAVSELYRQLAIYSVTSLSGVDEDGTPDPRILVGLREYVFDVSAMNGFFAPNKLYSKFAGRDISCALARSSYEDENINRVGHSDLTSKELKALDGWVSLFKNRFKIVGKLSGR